MQLENPQKKFDLLYKDNFLDNKEFKEICDLCSNLNFLAEGVAFVRNEDREINNQKKHVWFSSKAENNIKKMFANKISNLFNVEVTDIPYCNFMLVTKKTFVEAHDDKDFCDIQSLFYIQGNSNIHCGTGFYVKDKEGYRLNTHIGFEPNRFLVWDSKITHAPLSFTDDFTTRIALATQYKIKRKD
tara:strand:+ start:41 stop:598 length:558 start_codon:yes stop_codon:yes gene_type:complete